MQKKEELFDSYTEDGVRYNITRTLNGVLKRNGYPIKRSKSGQRYVTYTLRRQYLCNDEQPVSCYRNARKHGLCHRHSLSDAKLFRKNFKSQQ